MTYIVLLYICRPLKFYHQKYFINKYNIIIHIISIWLACERQLQLRMHLANSLLCPDIPVYTLFTQRKGVYGERLKTADEQRALPPERKIFLFVPIWICDSVKESTGKFLLSNANSTRHHHLNSVFSCFNQRIFNQVSWRTGWTEISL